ncbi:hypothetical protein ONZ45_g2381 [Pleurotus djamor]|nr:hypothetical protein ONZ45_g2381 [Pleurotus djamor]
MAALLAFAGTPNILPIHRSQGDPVSVSKTDKIHPLTISPQFQQQQRDLLLNALARGGFIELESPVEELPGRIYVKDPPRRTGLHSIRKGKVGARLPYEPWDDQTPPTFDQNGALPGPSTHNAPPPSTPDFTSDLDTDFLDFSDDHDNDDDDQDDDDYFDDSTIEVGPPSGFSTSELFNTDSVEPPTTLSRSPSATDASLTLSRSISVSSSSSLSDADEYDRPLISADSSRRSNDSQHSTSSQPHSSSAESDSDIPRSPPDDGYFCFPRSTSPGNESNDGDYEHHQDGIDMPFHPLDRTPHHSLYFHRSNSLGMGNAESSFEAGSSAGTVRGSSLHAWAMSRSRRHSTKWIGNDTSSETVDGSDWRTGSNGNYSSQYSGGSGGNSGYGRTSGGRGEGGGGYNGYNGGGRGNGGSGGDDGDDRRGRRGRDAYGHQPAFPSDTEDESESDDDYGVPSASNSKKDIPAEYSASDDDVPLAQRIPTALTAQKSIRLKVRAERDQRRKERAAKAAAQTQQQPRMPMSAMNPPFQTMPPMTAEPTTRTGRQRTMTMPSNTARPFAAEELTRRLAATQIPDMPTRSKSRSRRPSDDYDTRQPVPEMPSRSAKARSRPASPDRAPRSVPDLPTRSARSRSRPPSPDRSVPNGQFDAGRTLRPMRSFHRPNTRPVVDHSIPLPSPNDFNQGLARSKTDARARRRDELPTDHGNKSKSLNMQGTDATDFDQMMRGRRQDGGHLTVQRRDQSRSGRPSLDRDAYPPPRKSLQRQTPSPVPPLPLPDVKPQVVSQQRVFIGDMQSFNTVEISTATTALDVLEMVQAQGSLKHFHGSGGWMLFEVAQDFGMERPVRSFELLSDVQSSWNKDKMVNTFVIKMTPFSSILSRSNIPSSSPMHSGWLEYEVKRGKWSKRWVHLREHSLWMSKRDSGKDEVFICSLSNFDAYCVTRVHKAPKPYVFAVKSTDSLSFFENASDYLHIFSCSQQDGEKWMEVILLARSYVLYQEKNVLYNPKVVPSLPVSSGLNRSGTRKVSSGRPSQPLVEVPSPDVFAHGSLLQRK